MAKILAFFKLLRVHQWSKNLFIFLPVFFGQRLNNPQLLVNCLLAFLGFSLIASSVYIFNDFLDIEVDRLHPKKKNRPLANGTVTRPAAITMMILLILTGLLIFYFFLGWLAFALIVFYILQNIAYCIILKNFPLIDVVIISVGFVLRILIGGVVTHTQLSNWIILMTFLLALFLALAKRRDDVLIFNESNQTTRRNLYGYNLEFLNAAYAVMASVVIMAYVMFTVESVNVATYGNNLFLSSFFVILGVLRYLLVTIVYNRSGSPTMVLMRDKFMIAIILGWILTLFVLIYVKPQFNLNV